MAFVLQIDGPRWQANIDRVLREYDDVVPVIKSNGYGLGQQLLADRMKAMNVLSVGTVYEALDLNWDGDLLVLTPWQVADVDEEPAWAAAVQQYGPRLITTIADRESLLAVARGTTKRRVLLEGLTSTQRFGFTADQMAAVLPEITENIQLEGLALHLPMANPDLPDNDWLGPTSKPVPVIAGSGKTQQAAQWGMAWLSLLEKLPGDGLDRAATLWVSHLTASETRDLRAALPEVPVRPRIGTALWLGDLGSMQAYGVVLATHQPHGGVGYFQRRLPSRSHLAIVGGGTTHGVAMAAPIGAASARRKLTNLGTAALESIGRVISPFRFQNQRLWFAETPHASVSLIQIPKGMQPPPVGTKLPCQIRQTTAHFDRVLGLD